MAVEYFAGDRRMPDGYAPPASVDELRRRYDAGERLFPDIDLPDGTRMRGIVLAGAEFWGGMIYDADVKAADLRGCRFDNCNVKCTDFRSADLRGASFRGASVCAACWEGADLTEASFEGANYYGFVIKNDDDFPWCLPKHKR